MHWKRLWLILAPEGMRRFHHFSLTYLVPMFHFYTPWKLHEISSSDIFRRYRIELKWVISFLETAISSLRIVNSFVILIANNLYQYIVCYKRVHYILCCFILNLCNIGKWKQNIAQIPHLFHSNIFLDKR